MNRPLQQPHNRPQNQTHNLRAEGDRKPNDQHIYLHLQLPKLSRKMIFIALFIVVIAAGMVLAIKFGRRSQTSPIPATIIEQSSFPLAYPEDLPAGYHLDKNSFSFKAGILTFTASKGQKNLIFTEQSKPANFKIENLGSTGLANPTPVIVKSGQAVIGTLGVTTVSALITETTLVIISSPYEFTPGELKYVLQSLTFTSK